jgi:cytochrome c553
VIGPWGDIFKAIQQGTDKHGGGICPPMGGAPSGLTDQDALDLAHYIKSLLPWPARRRRCARSHRCERRPAHAGATWQR